MGISTPKNVGVSATRVVWVDASGVTTGVEAVGLVAGVDDVFCSDAL